MHQGGSGNHCVVERKCLGIQQLRAAYRDLVVHRQYSATVLQEDRLADPLLEIGVQAWIPAANLQGTKLQLHQHDRGDCRVGELDAVGPAANIRMGPSRVPELGNDIGIDQELHSSSSKW